MTQVQLADAGGDLHAGLLPTPAGALLRARARDVARAVPPHAHARALRAAAQEGAAAQGVLPEHRHPRGSPVCFGLFQRSRKR